MNITDEIISKFPAILAQKLKSKEVIFPENTKIDFEPIKVFRAVARETEDFSEVNRDDFKSYAELGKVKTRGKKIDTSDPHYYGTSSFLKKEIVEQIMKFPNPHKKMASGFVYKEGGVEETNDFTSHVCWWLFENVDLSNFKLLEEK